jgi:hypothetical protein
MNSIGYCDRRSGTCFCNVGYQGIDCSECQSSHYKLGSLCYPKKLCPDDCNGAGSCNYTTGACTCLPHRIGESCETLLCSHLSPLCEACTPTQCLFCSAGYYLTGNPGKICSTCYDFDPRCAGCTKELGCTTCADPILTSVRRSGYRSSDPLLPIEENNREFSITLPFGTKSAESFADAENFFVVTTPEKPLKEASMKCVQGPLDEKWNCTDFPASHVVCGHYGVFKFDYPNYAVPEDATYIYMTVTRSGGGYGRVAINYFIKHITTTDSDLTATAPYTTSLTLDFDEGVVSRSFMITINDDPFYEPDEVFQVVLETPVGGGSIGAQFRCNVTILDNDKNAVSPSLTVPLSNYATARAGSPFHVAIQAVDNSSKNRTTGGATFYSVIENDSDMWTMASDGEDSATGTNDMPNEASSVGQRNSRRKYCNVSDNFDGTYTISGVLKEQGHYQLRTWAAVPGGLVGKYYSDAFFGHLVLTRVDRQVNYTWGTGKILPRGSDYLSIRWTGAVVVDYSGAYHFKVEAQDHARLWVNGDLVLDHFHGQAANKEPSRAKQLVSGQLAEIVLEYRKLRGAAHARLMWATPITATLHVVPHDKLMALYEISKSPVHVHIVSADTSPANTECTGNGLFAAEALQLATFTVCPRDRFSNLRDDDNEFYLSTQLFSAEMDIINDGGYDGQGAERLSPILKFNAATHCFDGSYLPQRAGIYLLSIGYQSWRNSSIHSLLPVAGSPFQVAVAPTKVSGPYSEVHHLGNPTFLSAGSCWNFTIVARDWSRNLRLVGGDKFQVYMYQVANYVNFSGIPVPSTSFTSFPTKAPSMSASPTTVTQSPTTTRSPTAKPSSMPTQSPSSQSVYNIFQPLSDSPDSAIRYGLVNDWKNGTYSAMICPIIAGYYETHILVNAFGVSNQPFRNMDYSNSLTDTTHEGRGSYHGQYVANSPYSAVCKHSKAAALATTAAGPGLSQGIVGIQTWFIVTVRDNWGNILRTAKPTCNVTANIQRSSAATAGVAVWNYNNGSYHVRYTPAVSGSNLLSVYVDGAQIYDSPFLVEVADGQTTTRYSYAVGPGLQVGIAGITQYFEVMAYDLDGNRKSSNADTFIFTVGGTNHVNSTAMVPCQDITDMTLGSNCNSLEPESGHYLGWFTPYYAGHITIHVRLQDPATGIATDVSNSPFTAYIHENFADANTTAVTGKHRHIY